MYLEWLVRFRLVVWMMTIEQFLTRGSIVSAMLHNLSSNHKDCHPIFIEIHMRIPINRNDTTNKIDM